MHRANHLEHCFTYLFGQEPKMVRFVRRDSLRVEVQLQTPEKVPRIHSFKHDVRDQRALIVFDGDILWQGLPKSADEVYCQYVQHTFRPYAHVRQHRECEESTPTQSVSDNEHGRTLRIMRHGILMPAAIACVRRYRHENLTARYSLITVRRAGEKTEVEWTNSSY